MKHPVTYVQGPPGTGKTQTILNVVLSAFLNRKTVLVCSSNNRPVDGIIEKLTFNYGTTTVDFPYLRLGNYSETAKATIRIKELFDKIEKEFRKPDEEKLDYIRNQNNQRNGKLVELLHRYEQNRNLKEALDTLEHLVAATQGKLSGAMSVLVEKRRQELLAQLMDLKPVTNNDVLALFTPALDNPHFMQYMFYESLRFLSGLKMPRMRELIGIVHIEDDKTRVKEFNSWLADDAHLKSLLHIFPLIFSTNISSNRLGSGRSAFDMAIMDEAGQCNVAQALIPLARANSLLLVGDPNQLRPVILLDDSTDEKLRKKYSIDKSYAYKGNSILDIMPRHDRISPYIMLAYHYRCGRRIIDFSNKLYYKAQLNLDMLHRDGELLFVDAKNSEQKDRNSNAEEADYIVAYLKRNDYEHVSILTPFVSQAELINEKLDAAGLRNIRATTVHKVQGGENDTVILSLSISYETSKNTYKLLSDNKELINVAVTRAKNKLIVIADKDSIGKLSNGRDDISQLVNYMSTKGNCQVQESEKISNQIGMSNGSLAENELFKTVLQFCSVNKKYTVERNVAFAKIFADDMFLSQSKQEFDLVVYRTKWSLLHHVTVPVSAIELDGGEHIGNTYREELDKRKADVCRSKRINLVVIPNSFMRSYEYIREILLVNDRDNMGEQMVLDI